MKVVTINELNSPRRCGWGIRFGLIILVLTCLWLPTPLWSAETKTPDTATSKTKLHFGFSSRILVGFNENDASAAFKTWIRTIVQEKNINADPNPEVYHDTAAMSKSAREKKVDGISMTVEEYWALRNEVKFGRMVSYTRRHGQCTENYLLLTRKDANIRTLNDLKNRSLLILEKPSMSLALIWLDTQLMELGFDVAQKHFGSVAENVRLNKVVLPVFFRQSDACLVTESGYETLGELNPQVIQQMQILATSSPLLPSGTFFRADCPPQDVEEAVQALSQIHTTFAGQQLLTVFQIGQIIEPPPGQLDSAIELLTKHQELCETAKKQTQATPHAPAIEATSRANK